jgi:hypothetical protein
MSFSRQSAQPRLPRTHLFPSTDDALQNQIQHNQRQQTTNNETQPTTDINNLQASQHYSNTPVFQMSDDSSNSSSIRPDDDEISLDSFSLSSFIRGRNHYYPTIPRYNGSKTDSTKGQGW